MQISERILYSREDMLLAVEEALGRLKAFHYDSRFGVLGEQFLAQVSEWENTLRRQLGEPFTIVVIGDFKRGKSTFINALLGEEVAPANVTSETVTLNRISYGAAQNEAVLDGHKRIRLSDDELKRDKLQPILADLGGSVRRLELKRPCEILKKAVIIDTPGLNDALHDFSDMVEDAILHADCIIYLYNVLYPLSASEQMFLKASVLTQKHTKLFVVGNYADTIEDADDFARIKAMLKDRAGELLKGADFTMVSALDELCRALSAPRPNTALAEKLAEEFDGLRQSIEKLIAEKADTVIADRVCRLTDAMLGQLNAEFDVMENGLSMDREKAVGMLAALKKEKEREENRLGEYLEEIDRTAHDMENQAFGWMTEFMGRIEKETENLADEPPENLRKYYSVYFTDLVQKAMSECIERHKEEMFSKLEELSAGAAQKLASDFLADGVGCFRMNLDNRIWTKGDTVGLAVSFVSGTGLLSSIFSLGANAVAGAMRQKETADRAPELLGEIRRSFTELEISMRETLGTLYKKLAESAKKILTDAIRDEIADTERLFEETLRTAGIEENRKDEARMALDSAREILKGFADSLNLE